MKKYNFPRIWSTRITLLVLKSRDINLMTMILSLHYITYIRNLNEQ